MMRITYSDYVAVDLDEIFSYIAANNLGAAYEFVDEIERTIMRLADFPALGGYSKIKELRAKNIRMLPCDKYLIFYKAMPDAVYVYRIINGVRDYKKLF